MSHNKKNSKAGLLALSVGSIGMVYGDIGTSPLYAFSQSLIAANDVGNAHPNTVVGICSLMIYSLTIVVLLKYVLLLLRADNNGEGGILSLMALAQTAFERGTRKRDILMVLGIIGASLFYGDSLITPAISVLSAVEGLKIVAPSLAEYILPIAITIILLLFYVQKNGTEKVGKFFGPIMILWFFALAAGGILHIKDSPQIWQSFNPLYGLDFIMHHGWASVIVLGAVVLTITGAEALYADMGHFGRKPIQYAWYFLVMPALILNYLGQGALVLSNPAAASNPFFLLYPDWATLPMVILATMATVIASQAVITGAFSLTHQAVQLSLLPRMKVAFTSRHQVGQIFMPQVNVILAIAVVFVMIMFRESSNLASAYGIAVTGTMVISTLITIVVMRHIWKLKTTTILLVAIPFVLIDLTFFGANLIKFFDGGYMPVMVSALLIAVMFTWVRGYRQLRVEENGYQTINELLTSLSLNPPKVVDGTAIYFSSSIHNVPAALLHNFKHNKVLHERNILLTMRFRNKPYIKEADRIDVKPLSESFVRVFIDFGYMEPTNVPKALKLMSKYGHKIKTSETSFFISRRNVVSDPNFGMPAWQDRLFIMLSHNASDAAAYFHIPHDRVVELGMQVRI